MDEPRGDSPGVRFPSGMNGRRPPRFRCKRTLGEAVSFELSGAELDWCDLTVVGRRGSLLGMKRMRDRCAVGCLLVAVVFAGCRSAYYTMWETIGREKRDLLKANVTKAREEQQEAGEEFKDALTRLQELYQFDGGELEERYEDFAATYEDCESRAEKVRDRIEKIRRVAQDLFDEWQEEIQEISNANLQRLSREKLEKTRDRYDSLYRTLRDAEQRMTPVLTQLRDQVLYLKHNLNAQAIGGLQEEVTNIETDIRGLIEDLNRSIAEADAFIQTLPE